MTRAKTEVPFVEWENLRPPDSPNNWLVAPTGPGFPQADEPAPIYDVQAANLASTWRAVVEAQPLTEIIRISGDGLQIEAEQRSAVFGFVDRISSHVIALGPDRSTLAVYSRSTVGYWDLGVNRNRLRAWLKYLDNTIPITPKAIPAD